MEIKLQDDIKSIIQQLELSLEVETNNSVDRGKRIVQLISCINKACDDLENPAVPIQVVVKNLRKIIGNR